MLVVNCTSKLRKKLALCCEAEAPYCEESQGLNIWYGCTFKVEYDPYLWSKNDETYLLLINAPSLFSFYVRLPDELEFEQFLSELHSYFDSCFAENGFTKKQISHLKKEFREIYFAKAKSSRMLGYMRSMAVDYANQIREQSPYDLDLCSTLRFQNSCVFDLNNRARKVPHGKTPKLSAKYLTNLALRHST